MATTEIVKSDTALAPSFSFSDMERMAERVAKSNLFGCKTTDQALTLMLLSQAEGKHPIQAMREYHIIQNRPAMRADAMQAKFQQAGGRVTWKVRTDREVIAEFSHPTIHPEPIEVKWDDAKVNQAGLGNLHKTYPLAMKAARVIAEGVRAVMPSVIVGLYSPEEVEGFDEPQPRRVQSVTVEPAPEQPAGMATPEQVREVKDLLALVRLPPGTTDKWFTKAGTDTWEGMPTGVIQGCIDYIKERQPKAKPADAAPAVPPPADVPVDFETQIAGLSVDAYRTLLRDAATNHRVPRQDFDPGLQRFVAARVGTGKTLADLTTADRMELLEAVQGGVYDWATGQIPQAA